MDKDNTIRVDVLQRLIKIRRAIERQERNERRIQREIESLKATDGIVDKDQQIARLEEVRHRIMHDKAELSEVRRKAWDLIESVEDDTAREFLELRFYFGMSMRQVRETMGYSEPRIYKIQKFALSIVRTR